MHYLIDLDNTLLDTFFFDDKGGVHFYWTKNFKKDFGLFPQVLQDLFRGDFLIALQQTTEIHPYINDFLKKYHLKITSDEFLDYWLSRDCNINIDTLKWIKMQKESGHIFHVASNQPHIRMNYLLKNYTETFCLFDEIFTSAKLGVAKPHPDFFNLIKKKLDVSFKEICLIDDDKKNIQTAQALGMETILFRDKNDLK